MTDDLMPFGQSCNCRDGFRDASCLYREAYEGATCRAMTDKNPDSRSKKASTERDNPESKGRENVEDIPNGTEQQLPSTITLCGPALRGERLWEAECDVCDDMSDTGDRADAIAWGMAHECLGLKPCGCPVRLGDDPIEGHYAHCIAEQDYDYSFERGMADD